MMFREKGQSISIDLKCVYDEIQICIHRRQWSLTYVLMLHEICVVRDTTRLEMEE